MRRNKVVFPVPFRPTMPHRSRSETVKLTSVRRGSAPKRTKTDEKERRVSGILLPIPPEAIGLVHGDQRVGSL
jgi:hypothetical protein